MAEMNNGEPSLSQEDDGKYIEESLSHIEQFLCNLKGKESVLSSETKNNFDKFKSKMYKVLTVSQKPDSSSDSSPKLNAKQGAIPKRKPNLRICPSDSLHDDTDCEVVTDNDNESSSSSSSNEISFNPNSGFPVSGPSMKDWKSLFERLDGRQMASLPKFDENAGLGLAKYLKSFEKHCSNNFRGDRDTWLGELELHLQGKLLSAFQALRNANDGYDVTKHKLLEWFSDMKDLRRETNKQQFKNAKHEPGEPVSLFGTRLERLFKVAYPLRKPDNNRTLQEKFVTSVPKTFRKILNSQMMSCKINDQPITWRAMMKCARLYDLQNEKQKEGSEPEVIINVSQQRKLADAAIQCDENNVVYRNSTNFSRRQNHPPRRSVDQRQSRPSERTPRNIVRQNVDFRRMAMSCSYCKRLGHEIGDCRARWNLCFICGSEEHFLRDCPQFNPRRRQQQRTMSERSSSQPPRDFDQQRGNSLTAERRGSTISLQQPRSTLNHNALTQEW